jgi:hypothetical protein
MSEQPLPDLPTVEDPENPSVNGKTIHVDGCWPFLVWFFGPIRDTIVAGGSALIITTGLLIFGAYEINDLKKPLLEKYGEYIDGQTEFTATVKKAMESQAVAIAKQTESIEATKVLVAQNGALINTTSTSAIEAAAAAKIAASNANESARAAAVATADVATRLLEAKSEMAAVSKRRDQESADRIEAIKSQTGVLGELLSVQKEVLETLKDSSSKNEQPPPNPNNGGA